MALQLSGEDRVRIRQIINEESPPGKEDRAASCPGTTDQPRHLQVNLIAMHGRLDLRGVRHPDAAVQISGQTIVQAPAPRCAKQWIGRSRGFWKCSATTRAKPGSE
jgi:hypothetical protein